MLPVLSPAEFVAYVNQTLEYAYPNVSVAGEIKNFKVSRNMWVYFDIADEVAKVRCFTTIYKLPGPVSDGMVVQASANPNLHNQFGFSLNVESLQFVGEGTIKKASDLLKAKLESEGLFSPERKRVLPYAPERVGLVTSDQSAAFADFVKILDARWQGVEIEVRDTVVQGESAPESIISSLQYFNQQPDPPEVIVVIRGGGSTDDLQAFNHEQVVRAIASSRVPTLVAVGHEVDVSLSELTADLRASTPSNAAELLFPDKKAVLSHLKLEKKGLFELVMQKFDLRVLSLQQTKTSLRVRIEQIIDMKLQTLNSSKILLSNLHPQKILEKGYIILEKDGRTISSVKNLNLEDEVQMTMKDGKAKAKILDLKYIGEKQ